MPFFWKRFPIYIMEAIKYISFTKTILALVSEVRAASVDSAPSVK